MTEADWLTAVDPTPMVAFIRGKATGRQLAMTALALCPLDPDVMQHQVSREAVEWAERATDGEVPFDDSEGPDDADCYLMAAAANRCLAVAGCASRGEADAAHRYLAEVVEFLSDDADAKRQKRMAVVCRDIFGNPFRPRTVDPAWLTATVVALVRGIYADRAFDGLPILADALEDAGCDDEQLLGHCRGPGPHIRGCWAVDLVLARE